MYSTFREMRFMLTQEYLKEILQYNENTGIFTWLKKTTNCIHNRIVVGSVAGSVSKRGYLQIVINNKRYFSHRLAWLYVYGKYPNNNIDHINGITNDNRIENLRDVTQRTNSQNRKTHRKGSLVGSSYCKKRNKWRSTIYFNRKRYHLGYFETALEAHNIYLSKVQSIDKGMGVNTI